MRAAQLLIFLVIITIAFNFSQAACSGQQSLQPVTEKKPCFKEFAVLTGFAGGNLKEDRDYQFIPLIARLGFDLTSGRPGSKDLFEFELEPFFNTLVSPDSNIELGSNFLLKYGYIIDKKICPYIEGGFGIVYITQHTKEESTQFNFTPQAGAGISYFIKDNTALDFGYRYRHLSNAGIKWPNRGINVDMFLLGISWFY